MSLAPEKDAATRAATDRVWRVPLTDLVVDPEIEAAAAEAIRSGWWSMGPRVAAFEEAFAEFCGVRAAFAVANGTAALHLALLAVDVGARDEVLVPSLNFVAAANTIVHVGASPVFCDIEASHRPLVDPDDIEQAVGPATRAIVVMHYGGHPCRMDAVLDIAERYGLAVIEDAAHAPGASWRGQMCGAIGDVGCFSFFSNKNLPMGEGGMVVTDDDALAERIRLFRSHGMTTLTWDRHRGHASSYDVVVHGYNHRLDEIHAAIGLVQLSRLGSQNAARARVVERYRRELDGFGGLRVAFASSDAAVSSSTTSVSHHLAVIVLPPGLSREAFRASLDERGIQTSVHYPPIHRFSSYQRFAARRRLPVTELVADRLVTLPLFPHMRDVEIEAVTTAVREAISRETER